MVQRAFAQLSQALQQEIIGQPELIERLLICLLTNGHLLVEGAPGLAKTKAIQALALRIEGDFKRIQFTPDLLPGDITGTDIYRPDQGRFDFQPGPIFNHLILADEINRAPAKVQSALLEAMAERQVSIGGVTRPLPSVFLVMATQNPIEQEGTYPLPEAQLDRFLLHVNIDYPDAKSELAILRLARAQDTSADNTQNEHTVLSQAQLLKARQQVMNLHVSESVEQYIVQLTMATRHPEPYGDDMARWIENGISPRGTIALEQCAKAFAWLSGRDYVSPDDVQNIARDVMRHRLLLSFEAEAEGISADDIIERLLQRVPVI